MNVASSTSHMRGKLMLDEPMARHTSWRLGGPADSYYVPADLADLQHFLAQLDAATEVLWVGLGSNLLVRDGGFRGQVIAPLNALKQIDLQLDGNLYAECGSSCARLAKFCQKKGLAGADFFAGIPGTVGGALAMNAGAFGGETWAAVQQLIMIDRQGQLHQREVDEFEVGYRQVGCRRQNGSPLHCFALPRAPRRGIEYPAIAAPAQCHPTDRRAFLWFGVQESAGATCCATDRGRWSQGSSPRQRPRIGQTRQFHHQRCHTRAADVEALIDTYVQRGGKVRRSARIRSAHRGGSLVIAH